MFSFVVLKCYACLQPFLFLNCGDGRSKEMTRLTCFTRKWYHGSTCSFPSQFQPIVGRVLSGIAIGACSENFSIPTTRMSLKMNKTKLF